MHQLGDAAVQGRREQHPLAAGRGGVEYPGHGRQEAEVGHVVGLVEHGDVDLGKGDRPPFHQVDQAAGGGHHDVHAAPDRVDLTADRGAAVHRGHAHPEGPAERRQHIGYLLGELAGGHKDEAPGGLCRPRRRARSAW